MPDLTGVSRATWSDYERGKTEPDFKALIRISEYFRISTDALLKEDISIVSNNVHLKESQQGFENHRNVHPKVHPSVHLKDNNLPVTGTVESGDRSDKINDALILAINALERVNTKLLADLEKLNEENQRFKKEVPQIGHKMEDSDTKTA